ncbi:VRK1, partial [Cervus elaphus hippelaphus]
CENRKLSSTLGVESEGQGGQLDGFVVEGRGKRGVALHRSRPGSLGPASSRSAASPTERLEPAPSRRGDLEILGYCMIQWLSGHLPWEDNLKDPNYVRDSKIRYREDIASLMDKCFPEKNKPDEIAKYMETVKLLDYVEKPLYQKLRDILLQGLKAIGSKDDGKLDLTVVENGSLKAKPVAKRKQEVLSIPRRAPRLLHKP